MPQRLPRRGLGAKRAASRHVLGLQTIAPPSPRQRGTRESDVRSLLGPGFRRGGGSWFDLASGYGAAQKVQGAKATPRSTSPDREAWRVTKVSSWSSPSPS